jgi:hypothetical protein
MTSLGNGALLQIATKVLTRPAGMARGPEALPAAVRRAYVDLTRVSAPLIGQAGVDALTDRALHLAQRKYPWLVYAAPEQADARLAQVILCLERQDSAVATEAAAAVFAILTGLLVTFIGEPLTAHLLRQAWPDALSDLSTKESHA